MHALKFLQALIFNNWYKILLWNSKWKLYSTGKTGVNFSKRVRHKLWNALNQMVQQTFAKLEYICTAVKEKIRWCFCNRWCFLLGSRTFRKYGNLQICDLRTIYFSPYKYNLKMLSFKFKDDFRFCYLLINQYKFTEFRFADWDTSEIWGFVIAEWAQEFACPPLQMIKWHKKDQRANKLWGKRKRNSIKVNL